MSGLLDGCVNRGAGLSGAFFRYRVTIAPQIILLIAHSAFTHIISLLFADVIAQIAVVAESDGAGYGHFFNLFFEFRILVVHAEAIEGFYQIAFIGCHEMKHIETTGRAAHRNT